MSDYIIQGGELYHYGVKGMKWGVRADRTKRAYMSYRIRERYAKTAKDLRRLEVSKNRSVAKGKPTNRIDAKIEKLNKTQQMRSSVYNKTVSDLTPEDLQRGMHYINAINIVNRSYINKLGRSMYADSYVKKHYDPQDN